MIVYDWNRIKPEQISELYERKVALGETMMVARVEVQQGAATQSHSHDSEEVIIVLEGAWRFSFANGDVTLRPNQMLTIPPGQKHSSEALEDTVALDICAPVRHDWLTGEDRVLHEEPDQALWAV